MLVLTWSLRDNASSRSRKIPSLVEYITSDVVSKVEYKFRNSTHGKFEYKYIHR